MFFLIPKHVTRESPVRQIQAARRDEEVRQVQGDEFSEWIKEKLQERIEQVLEEYHKKTLAQAFLLKNTAFLRTIIAPSRSTMSTSKGGFSLSHVRPHCKRCPMEDYAWWISEGHVPKKGKTSSVTGRAHHAAASTVGKIQTWWRGKRTTLRSQRFFLHTPPQGMCDNLICARKLLAKLQREDNNLVDTVSHGIFEQSRRGLTDGLRDFVWVDNHEAVQIGDLFRHADGRSLVNDPRAAMTSHHGQMR